VTTFRHALVLLIAGTLLLSTCQLEKTVTPADAPVMPARGFYMGVLPIPGTNQTFEQVYAQIAEYSEFVPVWGRPTAFYDMAEDLSGDWGKTFVEDYTRGDSMFPLVHMSFMAEGLTLATPPGMTGATLLDSAWRAAYQQAALGIVRACRPRYLSLGNEVNRWFEKYGADSANPNGFQHYVSLYNETYDLVKALSPDLVVFCTFAREIVSGNRAADLAVLDMFDPGKLDLLVLTSYPHAVAGQHAPEQIADDYYAQAAAHFPGKPLGFSELGWPALGAFGGEQAQADFLSAAAGRLTRSQGLDLKLLGWCWLHDIEGGDSTGLIRRDGSERRAYRVWKELSAGANE